MKSVKAIRFGTSYLHWITRSGCSHGWFQLDAVLEWFPNNQNQPIIFVLGAAVPAGLMYAPTGPLLKQPPYSFQLIAGQKEHTIIRKALNQKHKNVPSDNSQPNKQSFEHLSWQINHCKAKSLNPEDLAELKSPLMSLNLVIKLLVNAGSLHLHAPVRHWNHRDKPSGWQIETGPVLWPRDLEAFTTEPSTNSLTPSWIHANQADRVTISGDHVACHELEAQLSLHALT